MCGARRRDEKSHLSRIDVAVDTLGEALLLLLVQLVAGLADALLEAFCRDLVVHLLHHVGIVFLRTHYVPEC